MLPAPYEINLYDEPSLFAGKLHAVIYRGWKNRVKGRDLYDYMFYLARHTPVNLPHLKERLIQSGYITDDWECSIENVKQMFIERFENIDFEEAKKMWKRFYD